MYKYYLIKQKSYKKILWKVRPTTRHDDTKCYEILKSIIILDDGEVLYDKDVGRITLLYLPNREVIELTEEEWFIEVLCC